ncbi:GTPase Era [Buchnera aphidicola]|uniref:GTPase Era n=1 Tax=Buchnera aphidicola TaxID=9 RepID=UPI0031B868FD
MKKNNYYCGKITIIGKTNVGKSTLLNRLIKKKISIISYKSNTTQKNIKGIFTNKKHQFIYIDTPGCIYKKNFFYLKENINISDIIIFVINKNIWKIEDDNILQKIKKTKKPIILVINKIDCIKNKNILLPYINFIKNKFLFYSIIPISSKTGENINILHKIIKKILPKKKHIYTNNIITNYSDKKIIKEIIREKFINILNNELPYSIKIKLDYFKKKKIFYIIKIIILVKNIRHKKIIIGKKGKIIKKCNILARKDLEKFFNKKVHLFMWIKYKF